MKQGGSNMLTSASAFCNTLTTTLTNKVATCEKASDAYLQYVRTVSSDSACAAMDKEVSSGRTTFDATKAASCAAAVEGADCSSIDDPGDDSRCQGVFTGKVANGGS